MKPDVAAYDITCNTEQEVKRGNWADHCRPVPAPMCSPAGRKWGVSRMRILIANRL